MPHASTFTRTWPAPGSGIGRSTSSNEPPALLICAASMVGAILDIAQEQGCANSTKNRDDSWASTCELLRLRRKAPREAENLDPHDLLIPPQVHDQPRLDLLGLDDFPRPSPQIRRVALAVVFELDAIALAHRLRRIRR